MAKPIGEGQYGKVYYPSLSCKDNTKTPKGNYVSKRMRKDLADAELKAAEVAKGQPWARLPIASCEYDEIDSLLFSEFGGKTMDAMDAKEWQAKGTLEAYFRLIEGVSKWNANCWHGDIKPQNIVWNGTDFFLIDFDKARCAKPLDPAHQDYEDDKMMQDDMLSRDLVYLYESLFLMLQKHNLLEKYGIRSMENIANLKMRVAGDPAAGGKKKKEGGRKNQSSR